MDPLSAWAAGILVSWWIKHFWENGQTEYAHALDRHAKEVAKAHPDWSQRRVQRHARRQTRGYWWDQVQQGFPDFWEARDADRDTIAARREEAKLSTAKRRRDAWQRIRDAKAEWERLHDEDRARDEAPDAKPDSEPRPAPDASDADPEIIDAEIVDDGTPTPEPPRSEVPPADTADRPAEPMPARPHSGADPRASTARPTPAAKPVTAPAAATEPTQPSTSQPAVTAAGTAPEPEGAAMPPRSPGHVVPANGAPLAGRPTANGSGGEAWTHGQFKLSVANVQRHAEAVPPELDTMLGNLTSVNAGRSQVAGSMRAYDLAGAFVAAVDHMLRESNWRAEPVVDAVAGAGGPQEIADMNYYRRV